MPSASSARTSSRRVAMLALLMFVAIVLRHAWMMDDTYITLRVVQNLFDGHGLVWNTDERVWVYTHPLWMMLCCVIYAITSEFFYSLLICGALISAAALAIVALRLSRSQLVGATLVVAATLSHAFVDYSTSGLENPLTNLLIGLSAWVYLGRVPSVRRFGLLCLLGGLAVLSRPDNALVLGPVVIAAGIQAFRRGARVRQLLVAALVAGIPLWLWELFALVYYGALIPNTALAKLNTGIESHELIQQGFFYALATLDADPLTLVLIFAGVATPLLTRDRRMLPFAIGIVLNLVYVLEIGGDFMLGRQFVTPMFMALICLSQLRRVAPPQHGAAAGLVVLLGFAIQPNTVEISRVNTRQPNEARTKWRITDERVLLYQGAGLVNATRNTDMPSHPWTKQGLRGPPDDRRSEVARALGFRGFYASPEVHYIDDVALTDPLLSRLPARYEPLWMHSHFIRAIPKGYLETVETRDNQLENEHIAALYDRVALVTQGELWSRERFAAIWWLNTGGPSKLVQRESWMFDGARERKFEELRQGRVADGTELKSGQVLRFRDTGVHVRFDERQRRREVEISVNDDDRFELRFYDGPEEIARVPVPRKLAHDVEGVIARRVVLPEVLSEQGFTRVRILPRTRKHKKAPAFALGHLLFDEQIDAAQ